MFGLGPVGMEPFASPGPPLRSANAGATLGSLTKTLAGSISIRALLQAQMSSRAIANFHPWSETLANWDNTSRVSRVTNQLAPNNSYTATAIVEQPSTGNHFTRHEDNVITYVAGNTYTFSASLAPGTKDFAQMFPPTVRFDSAIYVNYDLAAGVILAQHASVLACGMEPLANGYWRCWLTAQCISSATGYGVGIALIPNTTSTRAASFAGNTVNFIYAWGVMLNEGPLDAYVPNDVASGSSSGVAKGLSASLISKAGITAALSNLLDNLNFTGLGGPINTGVLDQILGDPAVTNLIAFWNARPITTVGIGRANHSDSTITLVDDTAELMAIPELAALLSSGVLSGQVYRLEGNTSGTGVTFHMLGVVNNLNLHTSSTWIRYTGGNTTTQFGGNVSATRGNVTVGPTYSRINWTWTPDTTSRRWGLNVANNHVAYVILQQMEENPTMTDVIVTEGAANARASKGITLYSSGNAWDRAANLYAMLGVPGAENRLTIYSGTPTDTTGFTIIDSTGNPDPVGASVTVVDDSSELRQIPELEQMLNAGLLNGKVYKLDNSGGASAIRCIIPGYSGVSGVEWYMSAWVRSTGVGTIWIYNPGTGSLSGTSFPTTAQYTRYFSVNTPPGTNRTMAIGANAGKIVYFILPQLEQGRMTPPIITYGAYASRAETAMSLVALGATSIAGLLTRSLNNLTRTITGSLPVIANLTRQNLLQHSNMMLGGAASDAFRTVTNGLLGPDRLNEATKFEDISSVVTGAFTSSPAIMPNIGTTITVQVFVKKEPIAYDSLGQTYPTLIRISQGAAIEVYVNAYTGGFFKGANALEAGVIDYNTDWWVVWMVGVIDQATSSLVLIPTTGGVANTGGVIFGPYDVRYGDHRVALQSGAVNIQRVTGVEGYMLNPITWVIDATSGPRGDLVAVLANMTRSMVAATLVGGTLVKTLANLTRSMTAKGGVIGTLTKTLGNLTRVMTASIAVKAALTKTLGNLVMVAAMTIIKRRLAIIMSLIRHS